MNKLVVSATDLVAVLARSELLVVLAVLLWDERLNQTGDGA